MLMSFVYTVEPSTSILNSIENGKNIARIKEIEFRIN